MSVILVVDDDRATRLVLRVILERAGHEIVEADHGAAALELIGGQLLPDLVITDLAMPILRGEDLVQRLRSGAATAAIPIVVVSGDEVAAASLKASGLVDSFVSKPFEPATLTQHVEAVVNRASSQPMVA